MYLCTDFILAVRHWKAFDTVLYRFCPSKKKIKIKYFCLQIFSSKLVKKSENFFLLKRDFLWKILEKIDKNIEKKN